ncbi:uncharacterized protein LOC127863880 [Dreissena polymorpha]|uniref:Uncharacterized protein n=1 Tax=Dreissena polymorpha TaxID=45954 RepID=A0A9D3Y1W5_DREPO|nr:uncharacterized protein LOC127863880 [Dreissena polymorpha]KAH3690290.1 hypothetical protein DPMN_191060 [Dreissena polymorpha]
MELHILSGERSRSSFKIKGFSHSKSWYLSYWQKQWKKWKWKKDLIQDLQDRRNRLPNGDSYKGVSGTEWRVCRWYPEQNGMCAGGNTLQTGRQGLIIQDEVNRGWYIQFESTSGKHQQEGIIVCLSVVNAGPAGT